MAKKKAKIDKVKVNNEAPSTIRGMRKLEVGEKVMYRTDTLIDKAEVISVDKEKKTAKLSNNVVVSLGVDELGGVLKIGPTDVTCKMRVWDNVAERELEFFLAKRFIKDSTNKLIKACSGRDMDKKPEAWVEFSRRLKKSFEKCGL